MKPRMPRKAPMPRRPSGHTAFGGGGGNRAFRDPSTMAAPDQAFTAAMAQPQGGATMPPLPPLPPVPGGK